MRLMTGKRAGTLLELMYPIEHFTLAQFGVLSAYLMARSMTGRYTRVRSGVHPAGPRAASSVGLPGLAGLLPFACFQIRMAGRVGDGADDEAGVAALSE